MVKRSSFPIILVGIELSLRIPGGTFLPTRRERMLGHVYVEALSSWSLLEC